MGKNNFRRMMMLRDHEKSKEPERDRLEEERERRERDMERRLRRMEDREEPRRSWRIEENRYIDPYPMPRYPDSDGYDRRMPRIGFSQTGSWNDTSRQYEHGGASGKTVMMPHPHLTRDEAEEWCDGMKNADGTTGPHWSYDQATQLMAQRNLTCNPVDFWATLCMMYSDYSKVARAYSADNPNFYADLAAAFLRDDDAVEDKIVKYWECIPASH